METVKYRLDIRSEAGVKLAEVSDFLWLSMVRKVKKPGYVTIGLPFDHALMGYIGNRYQIEVWRRDEDLDIPWYKEFDAIYRGNRYEQRGANNSLEITASGLLEMLAWRVVAYKSGKVDLSTFTAQPAETIMKRLVSYNAGANATTANERLREGAISGLTVQADGAGGSVLDWACSMDGLLDTLSKLADVGGGDFDLIKGTDNASWDFRWYAGQRGTDRSGDVVFALGRGNMGDPSYSYSQNDERTVCLVGGQDSGESREFVTRTGATYSAGNDSEFFLNATDIKTTAGLEARGDQALKKRLPEEKFSFGVLQTPGCLYGLHYFLGDLVSVANPFTGAMITHKVVGVTIGIQASGQETIQVETELV